MPSVKLPFMSLFKPKSTPLLRDQIVRFLAPLIEDYADWNSEHGLYLPDSLSNDPTAWQVALMKMKRALNLLDDELNGEGDLWEAKNKWKGVSGEVDAEKVAELEKEIREGLELFGRYAYDLIDQKYASET